MISPWLSHLQWSVYPEKGAHSGIPHLVQPCSPRQELFHIGLNAGGFGIGFVPSKRKKHSPFLRCWCSFSALIFLQLCFYLFLTLWGKSCLEFCVTGLDSWCFLLVSVTALNSCFVFILSQFSTNLTLSFAFIGKVIISVLACICHVNV